MIAHPPPQNELVVQAGFLPTRGSFMLDFVVLAMLAVVLILAISIWLVRNQKQYLWHKRIQTATVILLVLVLVAFEIDIRFLTDWRELAMPSRYYESGLVDWALGIHLSFAIPTPFVWICTLTQALRKMPDPPGPGSYSGRHRFWGWLSVVMLGMTTLTGWIFYVMAFVM